MAKPKTKLEIALDFAKHRRNQEIITDEDIDVAFAWLRGELDSTQTARAFDTTNSGSVYRIANCLRAAYAHKRIIIK